MSSVILARTGRPWLSAVLTMITVTIVVFLLKLYRARRFFRRLRDRGLPMPPHHPVFGHLLITNDVLSKLPRDAHVHYLPDQIRRRFPDLGPIYYLDMWPFGPPMLVVISPSLVSQFTQDRSLPKHEGMRRFLRPLTGEHDLVSMEGQLWKTWRNNFNPGFSPEHLTTLVPEVMEEVLTFRDVLIEHARRSERFSLEEATLSVTIDVIGRVALDCRFNTQRAYNDMVAALRNQIRWCTFGAEPNVLDRFNPARPFVQWYNSRRMNRYITRELDNRYATRQGTSKGKSVIDLALNSYRAASAADRPEMGMDQTFREFATSQMKLFIFAGHDTTAGTICYIFYLLGKHPAALRRVRDELDSVLGEDLAATASLITAKPHLLNQLPYTLAVIKESLRLFPAVSATRAGQADFSIVDSEGRQYPTGNCLVWGNHQALHRNPLFWPQPDEFLPERWLAGAEEPLHPIKNAWRPFEFGPRNCLGQQLALLEMKMIMALTLRELDVRDAYEEWDRLHGATTKGSKSVNGERAYQVLIGSAHPCDGFPCRVSFTTRSGQAAAETRHDAPQ